LKGDFDMNEFSGINQELIKLINEWEPILLQLPENIITGRRKDYYITPDRLKFKLQYF